MRLFLSVVAFLVFSANVSAQLCSARSDEEEQTELVTAAQEFDPDTAVHYDNTTHIYFENKFNVAIIVQIRDAQGNVVAEDEIEANGDTYGAHNMIEGNTYDIYTKESGAPSFTDVGNVTITLPE